MTRSEAKEKLAAIAATASGADPEHFAELILAALDDALVFTPEVANMSAKCRSVSRML